MATFATVKPVFLKQRDIPDAANSRPSVLEICIAAERVTGQGTILGAQEIRGLWRIYPATKEARTDILIKGMCLRNTSLQVANTNPFVLRDDTGEEKPSTKVWVDHIPMSVADAEIELALVKAGCELRSSIKQERARDPDHKLTRFLTGQRFVFISVPSSPLPKQLKVSIFTASIYHKEQKEMKKTVVCSRCLEQNHHMSQCKNDVVCRQCKQPGHKRGDAACQFEKEPSQPAQKQPGERQGEHSDILEEETLDTQGPTTPGGGGASKGAGRGGSKAGDRGDRSRPSTRQTTLLSFDQQGTKADRDSRARSDTPKRQRSKERRSPTDRKEKQRKRNDQRTAPSPASSDEDHSPTTGTMGTSKVCR